MINTKLLLVRFNSDHNKVFDLGNGITLVRPDMWEHTDHAEDHSKWATNFNMKEVHPQIATVMFNQPDSPYRKGDQVFLHYMAKETETLIEVEEETYSAVIPSYVFFKITDTGIELSDDVYLGEQVYTEAPRTASGIYLTAEDSKKEVLKITITHVPKNRKYKEINVGDLVCTDDDYQYLFTYEGKEYVKLTHDEIAAKFVEEA